MASSPVDLLLFGIRRYPGKIMEVPMYLVLNFGCSDTYSAAYLERKGGHSFTESSFFDILIAYWNLS
jgi:hypothetical protein